MALVEIIRLEKAAMAGGMRDLACHLDAPKQSDGSDTRVMRFEGWVVARERIGHVGLYPRGFEYGGYEVRKVPRDVARPDVLAAHRSFEGKENATPGFRFDAAFVAGGSCELTLAAMLADGGCVPLFYLTVKVTPMQVRPLMRAPLLLTSLGRSGSTYVLGLMARHPEILAYQPHAFDPRVASYWGAVFSNLAQPGSFLQQVLPMNLANPMWYLDAATSPARDYPDAAVLGLLGDEGTAALAGFARSRIDAFYDHVAGRESDGGSGRRFFIEKCSLRPARNQVLSLCPEAREILLVRDFRDALASILAFNRKRGYLAFGRELVGSDVEYVQQLGELARRARVIEQFAGATTKVLRYEELVHSPADTLRRLLSGLGLDASGNTVSRMLAKPDAQLLAAHRTTEDPAASIGRWKTDLPADLKAACREHLDPVLTAMGYEATRV